MSSGEAAFLDARRLLAGGPGRFNLAIERLLLHLGFDGVQNIDGAGDAGGDLLASRERDLFVFQNKWTTTGSIGTAAVAEVLNARMRYGASRAVVATNATPDRAACARRDELRGVGIRIDFWDGAALRALSGRIPIYCPQAVVLRPYQEAAVGGIAANLDERGRALLILATGLGKTVVGGEMIRRHLDAHPDDQVLVVGHMKELVAQLERALWRHLPKSVPTQLLTGETKPADLQGITVATVESALAAVYEGYQPALVFVDETHHLGEEGQLQRLLALLSESRQVGATATPWRGDRFDITTHFGPPCVTKGIADGMAEGYLAQVDYRLFVDDIDWSTVADASRFGYTVKQLNAKLFLPQRDEAVGNHLLAAWHDTEDPRAMVFCRSVEHAERMADFFARYSPLWRRAACLHAQKGKRERQVLLAKFRSGDIPIITAVDVLNEGVDVPDVNIIAFLRVTHSRRIFIQQLGRGLRVREGKDVVRVLDFVTDIRRIAAALQLRRDLAALRGPAETLRLSKIGSVEFTDARVGSLMDAWIKDAADLETALDDSRLEFPDIAANLEA